MRFKAWDDNNGRWLDEWTLSIKMSDGSVEQRGVAGSIGGVTVVPSTGLTDKHGREGFQCDLFRIRQGRHYWLFEIKAFPDIGGVNLYAVCYLHNCSSSIEGMYTYERVTIERPIRDCISKLKGGTIIGNSFEHPELLGEGTPLSDALMEASCL